MLNRRRFIASSGATVLPSLWATGPAHAQDVGSPTVICLVGVSEDTPVNLLEQIAKLFISLNLSVCCVVDFSQKGGFDSEVGQSISRLAQSEKGLFEVAVQLRRSEKEQRYFQMRSASKLRAHIVEGSEQTIGSEVITVFDPFGDERIDHAAYRGSGFRVFLRPNVEADGANIQPKAREQIEMNGGFRFDFTQTGDSFFSDRPTTGSGKLVHIQIDVAAELPAQDVMSQLTHFAQRLVKAENDGALFTTLPTDLLLQTRDFPAPSVSLALVHDAAPFLNQNVAEFANDLRSAGIPFSAFTANGAQLDSAADFQVRPTQTIQLVDRSPPDLHDATRIVGLGSNIHGSFFGLRADGRYQVALHGGANLSAQALLPVAPVTDTVIVVRAQNVSTFVKRAYLIQRLTEMRQDGRAKFHDLNGLVTHLFADDPILDKYQSTHSLLTSLPASPADVAPIEQVQLRQDANLAWQYILRYSHPNTGLCAGTVLDGANGRVNREATMWDIASQLNGIKAAREMGIIDQIDALERVETILANLPTIEIDGALLPPARFSTATGRPVSNDFDSCDTGRFLVALLGARDAGLVESDDLAAVLDNWDLDQTVRDGRPYDYINGRQIDKFLSHCTEYARHGYEMAGLPIASPFADDLDGSLTDQRISFMYRAASIGHFGTEPALLQEIELGPDGPMSYLARVMFDAQVRWYEKTGKIKCASETLLDFEPWFSYQGLRFDRNQDESWVVAFTARNREFQTPEFKATAEVISAKSAFLWAATVQHPYARLMLDFIREKARLTGFGFSAGVYTQSQTAMYRYSDINTNGIILTAIAHMLRN